MNIKEEAVIEVLKYFKSAKRLQEIVGMTFSSSAIIKGIDILLHVFDLCHSNERLTFDLFDRTNTMNVCMECNTTRDECGIMEQKRFTVTTLNDIHDIYNDLVTIDINDSTYDAVKSYITIKLSGKIMVGRKSIEQETTDRK